MRRESPHGFTHLHRPHVTRPVAEQMQAEARIVEERQVRARVAQAHHAVRVVEYATHRIFVGIEKLCGENGFEVFGDGQVEHYVQRIASLVPCNVGHGFLLIRSVLRLGDFDDPDLVPFTVEQAEGSAGREFGAQRVAKRRVRKYVL